MLLKHKSDCRELSAGGMHLETGCSKANGEKGMAEAARAVLLQSKGVVAGLEFGEHS